MSIFRTEFFFEELVQLDAQKSLWATNDCCHENEKTKRALLSRVVVAIVVAALLYQNAAVLHLNADFAIFVLRNESLPPN